MPTRVLMLTASGDVSDRVEGLEIGADDDPPKPFAFSELIAVRALGRRTSVPLPPVLELVGIKLYLNRREVFRDGKEVQLAPKEFAVLEALMRSEGAVVSAEQLLEKARPRTTNRSASAVDVDEFEAAEGLELPGADLSNEELAVRVLPKQQDEFTCMSCFLVHHRSQLAREKNGQPICRDCD
ncbi:hypothetical protein SFUMM280S_01477 [Streptomyces fumanus]